MPPMRIWPRRPHTGRVKNDRHGNAAEWVRTRFRIGKKFPRDYRASSVLDKGSKYGLGYTPTHEDMKMKKNKDQELAKLIPHLYRSFSI